jgi:hypothetical protein
MKTTKLLLLLTLFVTLLQSCTKDPVTTNGTPITKYEYLTAGDLNQTPYFTNPAFDTISFASDKGDTLTFVKTKTDSTWYCQNQSLVTDYKICYQTIHNSYTSIKGIGSFDVKHSRKINYKDLTDIIELTFNNIYFLLDQNWISPTFGYKYFIGQYQINNLNYSDALYAYSILGDTNSLKMVINKDFGAIRVFDVNEKWTFYKP